MLAKKYKSKIISISNPFSGIYTLEFKTLGSKYKYLPGQFLHLTLDLNYDGYSQWPDSRCFSMQSNPSEETIRITYAVKGNFTSQMEQDLKVGCIVWLKLPYGDLFTQEHRKENTVFIAGGTGITPFLSLFTHESFNNYINPKIYLGFRSKDHNIYQAELDRMETIREIRSDSSNSSFNCNSNKFVQFVYENEVGVIDINSIFNENGTGASYFISGPPVMIKLFKQSLLDKEVLATNILTDDWE